MSDDSRAIRVDDADLSDETLEALAPWAPSTLGDLADLSPHDIRDLFARDENAVWEIQYAVEQVGLRLAFDPANPDALPAPAARAVDPTRPELTLKEWTLRLAERVPEGASLTIERVTAVLDAGLFDLDAIAGPHRAATYKSVLFALAPHQPGWLYASDWKGSRDDAAAAFERLMGLPAGTLRRDPYQPLDDLANDANLATRDRGSGTARLYVLAPLGDDCVFARMTPDLHDALLEAGVIERCNPA